MQDYLKTLHQQNARIESYQPGVCSLTSLLNGLQDQGYRKIVCCDPVDFELERRLRVGTELASLDLELLENPSFINSYQENTDWRGTAKRWHMGNFYQWQRKRLNILMDGEGPTGGNWSFDKENRRKIPNRNIHLIPAVNLPVRDQTLFGNHRDNDQHFQHSPGTSTSLYYPTTHSEASRWLDDFLEERFLHFGAYEDAMVKGERWLYHSVLTPMLNTGLLEPRTVVERALDAAGEHDIPINSVEGFIRQIIGWREFMRATYQDIGVSMRNGNHWNHHRPLPSAFYTGSTGIEPVDDVVSRVLETGYCHHIERLMVVGGFMFLCEIRPDDIYRWFMEMFVDSYDWVMVPNVYAMSQHADGGQITTKPYFSGSNYIIKMSNYKKGEWSDIWDALFWRWILLNRERLADNFRWSMICKQAASMDPGKQKVVMQRADNFLETLK